MPLQLVTAPTIEPVSVADFKTHARVIDASEDELVKIYIGAARQQAETILRRALISQQWKMVADRFPSPMAGKLSEYWIGQQWGLAGQGGVSNFFPSDRTGYGIVIPINPVITVDSVKYIDTAGVQQTLSNSVYIVDNVSEPCRVMTGYGQVWPSTQQRVNAVEVTFTAGYGSSGSNVPEAIRHWIMLRAATLYENREEVAILNRGKLEQLPFVDRLLDPYRVVTF